VSNSVADIFRQAAALNRSDPRRKGNLIALEKNAEVIVSGDIHGNRENLSKIIAYAALDRFADRRLILQEIIHGPPDKQTGHDRSVDLLIRVARLKAAHPLGAVFILGNHDLAQATGCEITKDGQGVCKAFVQGVRFAFSESAEEILEAITEFILSMPLAVRCPNGVLICHSLPSARQMAKAGPDILLDGPYRPEDLRRGGRVYEWTWGRGQTAQELEELAEKSGASFFVLAHQFLETGFELLSPRGMVVISEHEHGCILRFAASEPLTGETALSHVRPIVALDNAI